MLLISSNIDDEFSNKLFSYVRVNQLLKVITKESQSHQNGVKDGMRRMMIEKLGLVQSALCSIELLAVRVRRWCTLTASWPKWCAVVYTSSGVHQLWCTPIVVVYTSSGGVQQQWCTAAVVVYNVCSPYSKRYRATWPKGMLSLTFRQILLLLQRPCCKTSQIIFNPTENPENFHLFDLA